MCRFTATPSDAAHLTKDQAEKVNERLAELRYRNFKVNKYGVLNYVVSQNYDHNMQRYVTPEYADKLLNQED